MNDTFATEIDSFRVMPYAMLCHILARLPKAARSNDRGSTVYAVHTQHIVANYYTTAVAVAADVAALFVEIVNRDSTLTTICIHFLFAYNGYEKNVEIF